MTKTQITTAFGLGCVAILIAIASIGVMAYYAKVDQRKIQAQEKEIAELKVSLDECKTDLKYAERRDFAFADICLALSKTEIVCEAELPENKDNPEFDLPDYQIKILKDDIADAKRVCWIRK